MLLQSLQGTYDSSFLVRIKPSLCLERMLKVNSNEEAKVAFQTCRPMLFRSAENLTFFGFHTESIILPDLVKLIIRLSELLI